MLFETAEIERRIEGFRRLLKDESVPCEVTVIHHLADVFYFSGTIQDGFIIIGSEGDPLFALKRNVDRAKKETPLKSVEPLRRSGDLRDFLLRACGQPPRSVGMALDVMSVLEYEKIRRLLKGAEIVDVSSCIRKVRSKKSGEELELMRGAARIGHWVYEKAREIIAPGMDEWQLSATLEYEARLKGNLGIIRVRNRRLEMYFGHILSGGEASLPSYGDFPTGGAGVSPAFSQGSTSRKIGSNEVVSIDTMINNHGYLNDQTRNFSLGKPPDILRRAFDLSLELHELFRRKALPGTTGGGLYDEIMKRVSATDLAPYFMGYGQNRVVFIGHGIGIEVDEVPFIARNQKTVIEAGMTVAFEPKFVVPGVGVVGIENTYLINDHGAVSMNISPEELVVL
ncbi:M24 family metallopeptidase [Thermodesulforhabdus norvegica]|uniref:Xaa-Pro aminopeptidase n=1 Tax=Thermodesulforhabdus norvegica TaxID=39841 RepID=A0A1I4TFC0_9BACT|nr:Xaa-Pro peptidase family protein [Thermodesulforhabdus norvegica]SFM75313.1 Xaa-Pro aminopeptidase [Thermodesulforhabdus norvegica]